MTPVLKAPATTSIESFTLEVPDLVIRSDAGPFNPDGFEWEAL